jgi:hypothetical protein
MKRIILLSIAVFGLTLCSMATPINQTTAKTIASKFMGANNLQLATTYQMESNAAALYVFNTTEGFIIVSADDCETPIIGYSREGRFDPNNVPPQMEDYLQDFVARIQYGIENHIDADEATARQWELVKNTGRLNDNRDTKVVAPLLTEMWEQGCLYNNLCPTMGKVPCGHAEVGCVAVAMGQIMHYWRYPTTGWGSHSYHNTGGLLSADFGNTTYDWDHMPDSLTDNSSEVEIEAVATLLFHCGVSVDMDYTANGSGADSGVVPDALIRYFNYSKRLHIEKRSDFDDEEWMSMLKASLDLQRPIFYGGRGDQGSHAFVCDGYDGNDLLHFNWGWGRANGYFALGHLNPIGYNFSEKNFAILDINPEYEPWTIEATAYPPTAGTIEGIGEYHIGDSCRLTATPGENYDFYYWKRDGQIISNKPSITLMVEEDILNLEAHFSCFPVGQISANYSPDTSNPNSSSVSLSWNRADTEWVLLKQIEINEEGSGVATDGENIYVTYAYWNNPSFSFGKYTMDGELLEKFNIEGVPEAMGIAYDGTLFYSNSCQSNLKVLHTIDLYNKTVIDSTEINIWFGTASYDPEHDGFWLDHNNQVILYDRQGQRIKPSPTAQDYIYGTGYFTAKDGTPHLLLSMETGVYDYDLTNNVIFDRPLIESDWDYTYGIGAHIGKYNGKEAMFIAIGYSIRIYEIKSQMAQIVGYRIYRADNEGNTITLADGVCGSEYIDATWNNANAGVYRFGISEVYANGIESEIIWSDTIVKTDFGINENDSEQDNVEPSVQKVIENGHVVIIKDGRRYSVSGQKLN